MESNTVLVLGNGFDLNLEIRKRITRERIRATLFATYFATYKNKKVSNHFLHWI
jgi:hypothetical protein